MKSAMTYLRKIFSSIKDTAKYDKHIKPNHSQTTTEMLYMKIKKKTLQTQLENTFIQFHTGTK